MTRSLRFGLALAGLALALAAPAQAQRFQQDARSVVASPRVLAMGNAGVALPHQETAFFYNPAHLARVDLVRPRITLLGARAELSSDVFDKLDYWRNELRPAIDEGIENLSDDEAEALYDEALRLGRQQSVLRAAVMLPAAQFSVRGVGVGAGLFTNVVARGRFEPGVAGIPVLDAYSQVDGIFVASGAAVVPGAALLPGSSLAAGVTGKYVRRYIAYEHESLDALSSDEAVYLLAGNTVSFDLGLHYANAVPTIPGRLDVGLALYDVVGGGFDYEIDRKLGDGDPDPARAALDEERTLDAFEGRDGAASFRMGLAYALPPLASLGPIADVTFTLDYTSASTSEYGQPALAKFSLGAQAEMAGLLALRLGMSQGYPSFGIGLDLPFVDLDYGFYGVEGGRLPGQLGRQNHLVQLRFGIN